jgi:hypothetical protein
MEINNLQTELGGLISRGKMSRQFIDSKHRILRMQDQIRSLEHLNASGAIQESESFADGNLRPLFNILQTEVNLERQYTWNLEYRIKTEASATARNVCVSRPTNPDFDKDGEVAKKFLDKAMALNLTYASRFYTEKNIKRLCEDIGIQETKKYEEWEQEARNALDELEAAVERGQLLCEETVLSENQNRKEVGIMSQRLDRLNLVLDVIKQSSTTGENSSFLHAISVFFAVLRSPYESDEQIKLSLDSVLAIARGTCTTRTVGSGQKKEKFCQK